MKHWKPKKIYRILFPVLLAALLAVLLSVYFRPLPFPVIGESDQLMITWTEMGVRNGEPYMDTEDFYEFTPEQRSSIQNLLSRYTYCRTASTLFSRNFSSSGHQLLYLFVFNDGYKLHSIQISSAGKLAVNGRNYRMKHAEQFIAQALEILSPENAAASS